MINQVKTMSETIQKNNKVYKDFEVWKFNYLVKDIDIVEANIKATKEILEELKLLKSDKDIIEIYENELEQFKEFKEFKKVTEKYKEQLKTNEEDERRIWNLTCKAYDILNECGFKRLAIIEVEIDMSSNKESIGYYANGYKKIFIHKETLDKYNDDEVIEILLHEYMHAWIDIHFNKIDKDANHDDSIIFGCIVCRLNRKLKKLGYDYKVEQNGIREVRVKWDYPKEMSIISDLRKSIKTLSFDIIDMIDRFNNEHGTVKVLADKVRTSEGMKAF